MCQVQKSSKMWRRPQRKNLTLHNRVCIIKSIESEKRFSREHDW
nr:MAG TPA: hypothetical protein [Caudoviricetes sp.]